MSGRMSGEGLESGAVSSPMFTTTHWSVVLSAIDAHAPGGPEALAQLCRTYWYPLYAFIRRKGYDCHDAEDLTQSFLVRLTTSDFIQKADPERGRFRSYLLTALNRFVADEWRTANRQRRGGGQALLSLDAATAEERYVREPSDLGSPERLYERRWATTLIEQALARLESEFNALGNAELFAALQGSMLGEGANQSYTEIAARLGLTEGAVKSAVYRLRQRYQILLREEIARTVATGEEVEDELRHLFTVLSR